MSRSITQTSVSICQPDLLLQFCFRPRQTWLNRCRTSACRSRDFREGIPGTTQVTDTFPKQELRENCKIRLLRISDRLIAKVRSIFAPDPAGRSALLETLPVADM